MAGSSSEVRYAEVEHETAHARVQVVLDLDGGSRRDIATGIGTLDHLLTQWAFFAGFDLGLSCDGDVNLDDHHAVCAIGTALGAAFCLALAESGPIERLGSAHGICEEALALVATDVVGHGTLVFNCEFGREKMGLLSTQSIREFLRAFVRHSKLTVHVHKMAGDNDHHVAEAIFKGLGQSLAYATHRNEHHRLSKGGKGLGD